MFGYSSDPLIYSENGLVKNIYSGHAAIYIGKENGEDYIVEAMAGGIVKNPAKYFVNRADGETFLGARLPTAVSALQQARVVALAKSLVGKNLGYDFDFHEQKGPGDKEWTCVGLTEKLYESANMFNPNNLGALEYDPAYYALDITPDGFDNTSLVNSDGDCFSKEKEFSKIARRTDIFIPAPEFIGYDVGREHDGERYFFLPYTQFLQPTLTPVAADVDVFSSFSREEINGPLNMKALVARWSLINNPISSIKQIAAAAKKAVISVAAQTKELAKNIGAKIFGSDDGIELTLIDDNSLQPAVSDAPAKNAVSVKKRAAVKSAKTAVAKAMSAGSGTAAGESGISKSKTSANKKVNVPTVVSTLKSVQNSSSAPDSNKKAATSSLKAEVVTVVSEMKATSQTYYAPAATVAAASGNTSSGSSSSGGSSAPAAVDYPKLAKINRVYSTGANDWVEIVNTTDHDFDLAAASYRLEKTKSAEDPSLLVRIGDADDASYPGGTIIKAHDTYLIVNAAADDYYKQRADAIVLRDGFSWGGSGYTLYLGTGAISASTDSDIMDAVGFGDNATYFLGSGPALEISDNYVLSRSAWSDDNLLDFSLVPSDDPAISWPLDEEASSTEEAATTTPDIATSTEEAATSTEAVATSTPEIDLNQLILIQGIYATDDNDWIRLYNPNDADFDLGAAGYRLEKAVSSQDPSLLMRIGDLTDGFYPGGTVIKAHDTYLIVRDDASSYYINQADAIATRTEFSWNRSGYSFYLGKAAVSSNADADIIDLVGFGPEAYYYEGSGPALEISDNYILNRLADTDNNAVDFNLVSSDDPDIIAPEAKADPSLFVPPVPLVSAGLTDIWHFDECYGGEGIWAVGKWDCSLQLGNSQEPLKISLNQAVNMNNGFSLSLYYRQSAGAPQPKVILSNESGDNFSLMVDTGMIEVEGLPNSKFRYYGYTPTDYEWHKLTLVVNQPEDYWQIYIDDNSAVRENFLASLPLMTALEVKSNGQSFLLDELGLWNRALSSLEIAADYGAEAPYNPVAAREPQAAPELLHFWSFEEDMGTTASDNVGGASLNLNEEAWVGRSHNNYAIRTMTGKNYSASLEDFPESRDLSMSFWWRDRADPYNGQADIYLTGGENNEQKLFAVLADNFRLDYWFNNKYGILSEGLDKAIPGGSDWHYLAFVYDSYLYKLSFYVDGEEKASSSLIYMPPGTKIGGLTISTAGKEAEIDDLALWQGALSPGQLKDIYTNNK